MIEQFKKCATTGCLNEALKGYGSPYCKKCISTVNPEMPSRHSGETYTAVKDTSSGGDNDYWVVHIDDPKRLVPYSAECEDLIEKFKFTFAEGEAFKALWRKGQANLGNGKPGDNPLRNAEKVAYMGTRMVVQEKRLLLEAK